MNQGAINAFAINSAPQGVNIDADLLLHAGSQSKSYALNDFAAQNADKVTYFKLYGTVVVPGIGVEDVELPCQWFKTLFRNFGSFGGNQFSLNYVDVLIPAASQYTQTILDSIGFNLTINYKQENGETKEYPFLKFGSSGYNFGYETFDMVKQFSSSQAEDSCLIKAVVSFTNSDYLSFATVDIDGIRSKTTSERGTQIVCNFNPMFRPWLNSRDGSDVMLVSSVVHYASATDRYMELYDYII